MKISKKILIPVFASAMGLSAIGGISGAVAWYQYNTKVEASFVGMSVADGGSLLIGRDNGSSGTVWDRSIVFGDGDGTQKLHPCTFGAIAEGAALPESGAKKHPEYGETNMSDWDAAVLNTDYFQYTFKLKAQKIVNNEYKPIEAQVNLDSFVLEATDSNKADVANAVRIHLSYGTTNILYSKAAGPTATSGSLDLNGDGKADYKAGYAWTEGFGTALTYGSGSQVHSALSTGSFLTVPEAGLTVTMTIWLEGWHSFAENDMSMWNPQATGGASIRFGMTLSVASPNLIDETAPQNP